MIISRDRRTRNRRSTPRIPEPLERKAHRRREDRRDSGRPLKVLWVQSSVSPFPVAHRATVSMNGVSWITGQPPEETQVMVHLRLPDMLEAAHVSARIERRRLLPDGKHELYATFVGIDLKTELSVARFIESRQGFAAAEEPLVDAKL